MLKPLEKPQQRWQLSAYSLSGRLLLLTIGFVMISVALLYFPMVARYHHQLLDDRINSAELAILPFTEAPGEQLSERLRVQLLARAGVDAVILRGGGQHQLFQLVGTEPPQVQAEYNAGETGLIEQIHDVIRCLFAPPNRTIRIDANMGQGRSVIVIANEEPIRIALFTFSTRALALSVFVSALTSLLVFISLYLILVRPMQRMTAAMVDFRNNPEDPSRILHASSRRDEIGMAERELSTLQHELYGFLQQKTRLAQLGLAVAKIQHDLRNILASAQLASDRLARVDDPVVKRLAPRIVTSLDHAVTLATRTLRFGRADEHPPRRECFLLAPLIDEAAEAAIAEEKPELEFINATDPALEADADREQVFRVLLNLIRNAAEAVRERVRGVIEIESMRGESGVAIRIRDNGTGIPVAVRAKLFQPFAASTRSAGTGLGLAIARDLARAHGGDVVLESTGESGTCFRIDIPDRSSTSQT